MAEDEEEASSAHPKQESSKGSIPRARQPRRQQLPKKHTQDPQEGHENTPQGHENTSTKSTDGPRRRRPDRHERQRRRQVAESSAPTAGPSISSNLNPSASAFVPRQHDANVVETVVQTQASEIHSRIENTDSRGNRGRPRGGRRGRNHQNNQPPRNGKENDGASTDEVTQNVPPQTRRPRNNGNTRIRVQPKIIKESEDLMLRMTESLSKGEYDCSICTDAVWVSFTIQRLTYRSNDGNQCGRVKSAGQSFIDLV